MSVGVDGLLTFLSEKVALCGEQGARFRDVQGWTQEYYSIAKAKAKLPFTPNVDAPFMERVWGWFKKTPDLKWSKKPILAQPQDGSSSNGALLNIDPAIAQDESPEASEPQMEDVATVTEDRVWRAITGHGIDYGRIPRSQFELLSLIANSGKKGIHQPELVRITGQDKRSVPKRTKDLEENGYILRKRVTWNHAATSWLILRKWVPVGADLEEMYAQAMGDDKADTHLNATQMARATLIQLKNLEENAMITIGNLRTKLGVVGRRPRRQILNGTLLHMAQLGWIKLYYTSINKPSPILTSVSLVRDPTPKELKSFEKSYHRSDRSKEALFSTPFITDIQGLNDRNQSSPDVSDENGARGVNEAEIEEVEEVDEIEELQGTESKAVVPVTATNFPQQIQRSANAGHVHSVGAWRPRVQFASQAIEQLAKAPFPGLTAADIGVRLGMKLYKKPFETLMGRLVSNWPISPMPHLHDFTVIRDITLRYKSQTFIYRTVASHRDAVKRGLTSWETMGYEDLSEDASDLDEWGFTRQYKRDFVLPDAAVSVSEAWKSAWANRFRIEPLIASVRGRPRKSHAKTKAAAQNLLLGSKKRHSRKAKQSASREPAATKSVQPSNLVPSETPDSPHSGAIKSPQNLRAAGPGLVMLEKTPSLELSVIKKALPNQKQWTTFKDQAKRLAKRAWSKSKPSKRTVSEVEDSTAEMPTSKKQENSTDGQGKELQPRQASSETPDVEVTSKEPEVLPPAISNSTASDKESLAKIELDFLLMHRTGAYLNPPMRLPATRGRPKKRAIIVVKSEKLQTLSSFVANTTDPQNSSLLASSEGTEKHGIPFASGNLIRLLDGMKQTGHIPDDLTPTRSMTVTELPTEMEGVISQDSPSGTEVQMTDAVSSHDQTSLEPPSTGVPTERVAGDTEMTDAGEAVNTGDVSQQAIPAIKSSHGLDSKQPHAGTVENLVKKAQKSSLPAGSARGRKSAPKPTGLTVDNLKGLQNGGTLAFRRRSVLVDILERQGGTYPGDREIGGSFRSEWQIRYNKEGGAPDATTAMKIIKNLIDQGVIARHSFAFKDKRGVTRQKSVIYLVNVENVQEKIKETQHRILQRYPFNYIPETDWFKFVDGSMPTTFDEEGVESVPSHPKKRKLDHNQKDKESVQKRVRLQQRMLQEGRSMPQYSSLAQNVEILNPSNPGNMTEAVGRLRVAKNEENFDRMWKHVAPHFESHLHEFPAKGYRHRVGAVHRNDQAPSEKNHSPSRESSKCVNFANSHAAETAASPQYLDGANKIPGIDGIWNSLQRDSAGDAPRINALDCLRALEWWESGFSNNPSAKDTKFNNPFITVTLAPLDIPPISSGSPAVPDFLDPLISALSTEQSQRQVLYAPPPAAFRQRKTLKPRAKPTGGNKPSQTIGAKRGPKAIFNLKDAKRAKTGHRLWENGRSLVLYVIATKLFDPKGELNFLRLAELMKAMAERNTNNKKTAKAAKASKVEKDASAIESQWKELESTFDGMIEFLVKMARYHYNRKIPRKRRLSDDTAVKASDAHLLNTVEWMSPFVGYWEDEYAATLPSERSTLEKTMALIDDGEPLELARTMKEKFPSQAQKRRMKKERFRTALCYEAYVGKPRKETHASRIKKKPSKARDNTGRLRSKLELTKNLVRANILVPDHKYDKNKAKAKFEKYGNNYIDQALREMTQDRTILRLNKRKDIVGRNWKLNHRLFEQPFTKKNFIGFKRFFSDVDGFKEQLDDTFRSSLSAEQMTVGDKGKSKVKGKGRTKSRKRETPRQDLSWDMDNGHALQVLEGMASNRIKLEVRVPPARKILPRQYDIAKPVEPMATYDPKRRVSKFGFNKMRYKSMHTDMSNCVFPLRVRQQPAFTPGVPVPLPTPSKVTVPEAPRKLPGSMKGRLPLWVDINGDTVEPMFCQMVSSASFLCAFRPGTNAERLRYAWGGRSVGRAEAHALVKWMLRAKILQPFGPKRHSMGLTVRDGGWDKVARLVKKATAGSS